MTVVLLFSLLTSKVHLPFRLHILAQWMFCLPLAYYLGFIARPTFGMTGLWIGIITAQGLAALVSLVGVVTIDWEREVRRAAVRLARLEGSASSGNIRWTRKKNNNKGIVSAFLFDEISYLTSFFAEDQVYNSELIALPAVGSRSLGGFRLLYRTMEEQLQDLEAEEFGII